jgi:hypothetical protein
MVGGMNYHRLIHRLRFQIGPLAFMEVPLNRQGNFATGNSNGMPRAPVKRTVDLRPGDEVMSSGVWQQIIAIEVTSQWWLTEEAALSKSADGDGYLYRPKRQPIPEISSRVTEEAALPDRANFALEMEMARNMVW